MIRPVAALMVAAGLGQAACAQDLRLPPGATPALTAVTAPDTLKIATSGWEDGALPSLAAKGSPDRSVWSIPDTGQSAETLVASLRDQLKASGFAEVFGCTTEACGGFDFRFALDLAPPPALHVNLGDFHYWAGQKGEAFAAVFVTQIAGTAYVQIDRVGAAGAAPVPAARVSASNAPPPTDLITALQNQGRAILSDLSFATGTSTLAEGAYGSLAILAAFLKNNPTMQVALVGHTDTSGSLNGNISLSKRRAQAVLQRLTQAHGIPAAQLAAEGMGYLAPVANNLTLDGREANRRVEVIILSQD